jgi:LacI family transcriptional regulator
MHYPVEEMASYAARLAIELSSNPTAEPAHRTHLFLSQLIERDSVAVAG